MAKTLVETGQELTAHQAAFASAIREQSEKATAEVAVFQRRREALDPVRKGPLEKLDQTIQLTQLMADELLLMNRQVIVIESSIARVARPVKGQRELVGEAEPATAPKTQGRGSPSAP